MLGQRLRFWLTINQHLNNVLSLLSRCAWIPLSDLVKFDRNPANTGNSPTAVSMLGQRRRRCVNIETALGECPVFAGK